MALLEIPTIIARQIHFVSLTEGGQIDMKVWHGTHSALMLCKQAKKKQRFC